MSRNRVRPLRVLRTLWKRWQVIAHAIGNFQARLLLSVLYFVLIPPFSLIVRTMMDPLQLRGPRRATFWTATPPKTASLARARGQS